eukprot:1590125-Pyramimonas_sp.AAC.2
MEGRDSVLWSLAFSQGKCIHERSAERELLGAGKSVCGVKGVLYALGESVQNQFGESVQCTLAVIGTGGPVNEARALNMMCLEKYSWRAPLFVRSSPSRSFVIRSIRDVPPLGEGADGALTVRGRGADGALTGR